MTAPGRIDTYTGEYPPGLYEFDMTSPKTATLASVAADDLAQYRALGFLAVERALDSSQVQSALDGLRAILLDPGDVDLEFEAWATSKIERLNGEERFDAVRKFMWFVHADERLNRLAHHPALLSVVRTLVGSDDVVLLQDMALLKPPGGGREKPWHQDNAYFKLQPDTPTLGVWIALDPATPENGCMHVIPGSHLEGPRPHFMRRDWQICDTDVATARDVMVPLAPGGALFFNGLLQHGTPTNRTDSRRRAIQFHYVPSDAVEITEDDRLAIYGLEGRGAEC